VYGINIKTPFIENLTHRIPLEQYCFQPSLATHSVVSTHTFLVGSYVSDPQRRFFYHYILLNAMQYYGIQCIVILFLTVQYCTIHYYAIYNNILHNTVQTTFQYTILYYTLLYYIKYYTIVYCSISKTLSNTIHCITVQHCTILYFIFQCNTTICIAMAYYTLL
jgi:hypothetical protein